MHVSVELEVSRDDLLTLNSLAFQTIRENIKPFPGIEVTLLLLFLFRLNIKSRVSGES